jgi:hypothetical protein
MKTLAFTFPLLLMAALLTYCSLMVPPWSYVLFWPAGALVIVAVAYMVRWHGVFGKRPDGRLRWLHVIVLLPYLASAWLAWRMRKWVWQEEPWTEVAEGIYLGRRLGKQEMPEGIELVVDMTAEFRERPGVRKIGQYICLPTLDGTAPKAEAFDALVDRLAVSAGPMYVHCAVGYGRSATVVAAVLLRRGLAQTPGQVVHHLQTLRPGVAIGRGQYRLIRATAAGLEQGNGG